MPRPMFKVRQYPVQGVPTIAWHCNGCNGKAHTQPFRNPQTGRTHWQQVRLTGSADEYRPDKLSPHEQLQIPVAYTLGDAPRATYVQTTPLQTPMAGARLDPLDDHEGRMLTPDHPWHPNNIRERLQPVSLAEFGGR